jgi:hypothetical protein
MIKTFVSAMPTDIPATKELEESQKIQSDTTFHLFITNCQLDDGPLG